MAMYIAFIKIVKCRCLVAYLSMSLKHNLERLIFKIDGLLENNLNHVLTKKTYYKTLHSRTLKHPPTPSVLTFVCKTSKQSMQVCNNNFIYL